MPRIGAAFMPNARTPDRASENENPNPLDADVDLVRDSSDSSLMPEAESEQQHGLGENLAEPMPVIAVIGGMDPTGGAGLLRDAWTILAGGSGIELRAVATALTRQGHGEPAQAFAVPPPVLERELERLLACERLAAIKIGMIAAGQAELLARALERLRARSRPPKLVLDPVLLASDGGRIGASVEELRLIAGLVDLVTPNREEEQELGPLAGVAILHKGEPVPSAPERIVDRMRFPDGREHRFERARNPGPDPRGTGCALASRIALGLAHELPLLDAVGEAIAWLDAARTNLRPGPDGRWHLRHSG